MFFRPFAHSVTIEAKPFTAGNETSFATIVFQLSTPRYDSTAEEPQHEGAPYVAGDVWQLAAVD